MTIPDDDDDDMLWIESAIVETFANLTVPYSSMVHGTRR